ncbi:11453_t:CDS:2, partial [Acaulospora morrowiae]
MTFQREICLVIFGLSIELIKTILKKQILMALSLKAMYIITKQKQEKLAQLLVEFIIEDCQPLHILRSSTFCRLLNNMEPEFQIPCQVTVKKMIDQAYDWSRNQLFDYLVLMLPLKSERCDKLDGEYLKLINLTKNECQLLDDLIPLLKPFYDTTTIFSGSNYPTLNLIYPTMRLLIKEFMPFYGQTEDDYANLLFGPKDIIDDQDQLIADNEYSDKLDEAEIDDDSETLMVLEQLRQPLQVSKGRKKKQDRRSRNQNNTYQKYNDPRFKGRRLIKHPVTTKELNDLVKAASYLSLQQYWEVPEEVRLVASFLDPQIKNLKFIGNEIVKINIINTVQKLYIKKEYRQPS